MQPIIQVTGLTRSIDTGTHRVDILRGIDFDVPKGQFVAIMGASGSGKSTLLGLLAGLDAPTTGKIVLDGVDITNLEINGAIHISELPHSDKYKFLGGDEHAMVAHVTAPREVAETTEATGSTEPEVAKKGKQEAEGDKK